MKIQMFWTQNAIPCPMHGSPHCSVGTVDRAKLRSVMSVISFFFLLCVRVSSSFSNHIIALYKNKASSAPVSHDPTPPPPAGDPRGYVCGRVGSTDAGFFGITVVGSADAG